VADGSELIARAIASSGRTIYNLLDDRPDLFYPIHVLEQRLRERLMGLNLAYPIRTRAKVAKEAVCTALGYPVPAVFARTQPRFPGQDLDVYVQKADNLQIWNEEISATRRYALIRLDPSDTVTAVRVVTGEALADLDRTGTLTSKFQARRRSGRAGSRLVSERDTTNFETILRPQARIDAADLGNLSPTDLPEPERVLTAHAVYERLERLVGHVVHDPGLDQERLRGEAVQRLASEALGLAEYVNRGQWPDILSQVIEVKLQIAATVDLGVTAPDGIAIAEQVHPQIRHCDVRYAIFYAERLTGVDIGITALVLSTGESFFTEFQRFEGMVQNKKIQLPLPRTFFDDPEALIN
jgi:hypothetical protein